MYTVSYFHCVHRTCALSIIVEILPNNSPITVTIKDFNDQSYKLCLVALNF